MMISSINPRAFIERKHEYRPTLVRRGASSGANATIVCGVTLGEYCFVGAGAVVTRDVPAHALLTGNPARQRGWVCTCGVRPALPVAAPEGAQAECTACGPRFVRHGAGLSRQA